MEEIGTWTTSEGTVSATLQYEADMAGDVNAQELPGWVSGAFSGALGGAAAGSAAGPWGALIGAAAGATIGGVAAATAPAPPKPAPPQGPPPALSSPPVMATPPPPATLTAPAPTGSQGAGAQTSAVQALQQFAAAVPALIQLVAANNATAPAKPSESFDADGLAEFMSAENLAIDEWTSASESEGAWSIP